MKFSKIFKNNKVIVTASMSFDSRLKMDIGSAQNLLNWIKKIKNELQFF